MPITAVERSIFGRVKKEDSFPQTENDGLTKFTRGVGLAESRTVSWSPDPESIHVRNIMRDEKGRVLINPLTGGKDVVYKGNTINSTEVQLLTTARGKRGRKISPQFDNE